MSTSVEEETEAAPKEVSVFPSHTMAEPRRVELIPLPSNVPLLTVDPKSPVKVDTVATIHATGLIHGASEDERTTRIELMLFESDERRFPEFSYFELLKDKVNSERELTKTLDVVKEDKEKVKLEALARRFEQKYGGATNCKGDRLQDLVDIGFGYDDNDSFIDNSEAYDEFVPASLTTKLGGFYINSGKLQFRLASDEETENDKDDFEENKKSTKRKMKDQEESRAMKKTRNDDLPLKNNDAKPSGQPDNPAGEKRMTVKKKKAKRSKGPDIADMLKKFHKEKLHQLQMFTQREQEMATIRTADTEDEMKANTDIDPLLTFIASASGEDLVQAASVIDLTLELDVIPDEPPQNRSRSEPEESRDPVSHPVQLPNGLPPALERRITGLTLAAKALDGESNPKLFSQDVNSALQDVELMSRELGAQCRSGIFSHLASQLQCSQKLLLKKARELHLHQQVGLLGEALQRLKEAIGKVMPEQVARFHENCQAHSEAQAAKLMEEEREREQRAIDGSDEDEEEEKCGKRVFGPRKRFRWNEELRDLVCEVVKLKMRVYDLDEQQSQNLEEYLRTFLETELKPLWPKGWMQSRILMIESRRVHGPITGIVARKKPVTISKPPKGLSGTSERRSMPSVVAPQLAGTDVSPDTMLPHALPMLGTMPMMPAGRGDAAGSDKPLASSGVPIEAMPVASFPASHTLLAAGDPGKDQGPSGVAKAKRKRLRLPAKGLHPGTNPTASAPQPCQGQQGDHPSSPTSFCLGPLQSNPKQHVQQKQHLCNMPWEEPSISPPNLEKSALVNATKRRPPSSGQTNCLAQDRKRGTSAQVQSGSDSKAVRSGQMKAQRLTLTLPPGGAQGDGGVAIQGVARLFTTPALGDMPISMETPAVEGCYGDPALPSPSLSLLPPSYADLSQPLAPGALGVSAGLLPIHAFTFSGLTIPGKPLGPTGACKDTISTFQHSLAHDGNPIHAEGPNDQRKLH